MSKVKVHLRVAQVGPPHRAHHKVAATIKPSNLPLLDGQGRALPTIAFAVVLDIDQSAFKSAERVLAELFVGESDIEVAAAINTTGGTP